MKALTIEVYGDPVPQGSKKAFVVGRRAVIVDDNKTKLKTWRSEIVSAFRDKVNGDESFDGPVRVTLFFWLKKPNRPKNALPIVRPDTDKLERAVLDALTAAGVFRDDAQVTTLSSRKRYTTETPRCVIAVAEDG